MKMKNAWNWMKAHSSLATKGTQILFIVIHVDPLFLSANILYFPISTRLWYRRVYFYHTVVRYSKAFLAFIDVTWFFSMYANICLLYVSRIHVLCCKSPIEQNILQADFWPFVCSIYVSLAYRNTRITLQQSVVRSRESRMKQDRQKPGFSTQFSSVTGTRLACDRRQSISANLNIHSRRWLDRDLDYLDPWRISWSQLVKSVQSNSHDRRDWKF